MATKAAAFKGAAAELERLARHWRVRAERSSALAKKALLDSDADRVRRRAVHLGQSIAWRAVARGLSMRAKRLRKGRA